MIPVVLLRESTLSLLYVHVIASHVFCLPTPLWQPPRLPWAGCSAILLGTVTINTRHITSAQPHLSSISRLPHLSIFSSPPRPPLALPTHFTRPFTQPSLGFCCGPFCWLVWRLPFRWGKCDRPLSNLWPFPALSLPGISGAYTDNFTDNEFQRRKIQFKITLACMNCGSFTCVLGLFELGFSIQWYLPDNLSEHCT